MRRYHEKHHQSSHALRWRYCSITGHWAGLVARWLGEHWRGPSSFFLEWLKVAIGSRRCSILGRKGFAGFGFTYISSNFPTCERLTRAANWMRSLGIMSMSHHGHNMLTEARQLDVALPSIGRSDRFYWNERCPSQDTFFEEHAECPGFEDVWSWFWSLGEIGWGGVGILLVPTIAARPKFG